MPTNLPFKICLSLALDGAGAPTKSDYETALSAAEAHLSSLLSAPEPLELFTILDRSDDLAEISRFAEAFTTGARFASGALSPT